MMRLRTLGATCTKLEPPAGDPMARYNPAAFTALHQGVKLLQADLRTPEGRSALNRELARSEVLLTSFRPAALASLGLGWKALHKAVYAIVLLGLLHFFWMRAGKNDFGEWTIYAVIVAVLLGWRLRQAGRRRSAARTAANQRLAASS